MKKKYMPIAALAMLLLATPATAQNWVRSFLDRYQSAEVNITALETSLTAPATLASLAQDGGIPLRVNDVIRMALENNMDMGVNRFTPMISAYAITQAYQRFDPILTLSSTVGRNTFASVTQLDGADTTRTLTGRYSIAYNHQLEYGSNYSVQFSMNRQSSNSTFSTVNPSYRGTLTYSFTQPLLNGYGRFVNTSPITIARNNLEISEIAFERQVMDLVAGASNLYWDLVYARENIRVQEAALELAGRTLRDNRTRVEIGTLAPIDLVQAESAVATRQESLVVARYSQTQIEDSLKTVITRVADPAIVLLSLNPVEDVPKPQGNDHAGRGGHPTGSFEPPGNAPDRIRDPKQRHQPGSRQERFAPLVEPHGLVHPERHRWYRGYPFRRILGWTDGNRNTRGYRRSLCGHLRFRFHGILRRVQPSDPAQQQIGPSQARAVECPEAADRIEDSRDGPSNRYGSP